MKISITSGVLIGALVATVRGQTDVMSMRAAAQPVRNAVPRTPPVFIANRGQFATDALFVAQFPGMLVRVERGALALQLYQPGDSKRGALVRMEFEGAAKAHEVQGEHQQDIVFSYFRGADPSQWRSDVGAFGQVRLRGLYEGVDLIVREEAGIPKYDLEFERAADVSRVVVRVEGVEEFELGGRGELRLTTAAGPLQQPEGRTWQLDDAGEKKWLHCRYTQLGERSFGFSVEGAATQRRLVIDPALVWGSMLGSSGIDSGDAVEIADDGTVVVAGSYAALNFPITPGAFQVVGPNWNDIFIAKMAASTGQLVYAASIGGWSTQDRVNDLEISPSGEVTAVGTAFAHDFPTTPGAYDSSNPAFSDAFVLRLNAQGSQLVFSTYLGNTANDDGNTLAVAPSGATIVAGLTGATLSGMTDFPTTPGAYKSPALGQSGPGFVTRINPTGTALEWSTLANNAGPVYGIALDANENVTLVARAATSLFFPVTPGAIHILPPGNTDTNVGISRLRHDGAAMLWSGLFGGSGSDYSNGLALDARGDVYVCGRTFSANLPVTPGAHQTTQPGALGFVGRVSFDGSTLRYLTYLAGQGFDIHVDPSGVATTGGEGGFQPGTGTPGAFATQPAGVDGFAARLLPDGSRVIYYTYYGGPGNGYAWGVGMNSSGRIALTGYTPGGAPTTPGAAQTHFAGGQWDAFIGVLDLNPTGVETRGASTSSCLGPLQLQASRQPLAGASNFELLCSAAPPSATGWLLISTAPAALHSSRGAAALHVAPDALVARIAVDADAWGFVSTPVPSSLMNSGARFYAQYVFPSNCGTTGGWCSSNGLEITVQ